MKPLILLIGLTSAIHIHLVTAQEANCCTLGQSLGTGITCNPQQATSDWCTTTNGCCTCRSTVNPSQTWDQCQATPSSYTCTCTNSNQYADTYFPGPISGWTGNSWSTGYQSKASTTGNCTASCPNAGLLNKYMTGTAQ